jgi:hypothetical protein
MMARLAVIGTVDCTRCRIRCGKAQCHAVGLLGLDHARHIGETVAFLPTREGPLPAFEPLAPTCGH